MITQSSGDVEKTEQHMHGLHRVVMLRGGLRVLKKNPQLQIKVCR
jgi:hypothetical protein